MPVSMPEVPKKIMRWIRVATFGLLLGFVLYTLRQQQLRWADLRAPLQQARWQSGWPLLLVGLLPLNWSLEALKWQWLARRVVTLPFWAALRGVLAGLSLSMALPGPLGDAAGRVLSIQATQRAGTVGAALVAGGMQLYVALVTGTFAWATYLHTVPVRHTPVSTALLVLLTGLGALGVILNFFRYRLVSWSARWPLLGRYVAYWQIIGQYSHGDMAVVFGLALLRHLTFSGQLYAAFRLYGVALPTGTLAACIGVIYLAKTLAPAINWLSDLGIREAATLWVLTPFGLAAPPLLAATLTLWLVNIGLPTLIGLVSVWRLRLSPVRSAPTTPP